MRCQLLEGEHSADDAPGTIEEATEADLKHPHCGPTGLAL